MKRFLIVAELDDTKFSTRDREYLTNELTKELREQAVFYAASHVLPSNLVVKSVEEVDTAKVVL